MGPSLAHDLRDLSDMRTWWRGAATCSVLCGATLALASPPAAFVGSESSQARRPAQYHALQMTPLERDGTGQGPATAEDLTAALIRAGAAPGEAEAIADAVAIQAASGAAAPITSTEISVRDHSPAAASGGAGLTLKIGLDRDGRGWRVERIRVKAGRGPVRVQGKAGSDLGRSMRALGVSDVLLDEFLKALGLRDAPRLSPDDRFELVVEQRIGPTGKLEAGRLLYASLSREGAPPLRAMRWQADGVDPVAAPNTALARPVDGRITSGFGERRHPILGYRRRHKGIDIGAPLGTPVKAAADGRVTFGGWRGGYGKQVRIGHGNGLTTSYSHMSSIAAAPGSLVRKGQVIGRVGWTGLATGPHLHYEVHRGSVAINPQSVGFGDTTEPAKTEISDFERMLRRLRSAPIGRLAP